MLTYSPKAIGFLTVKTDVFKCLQTTKTQKNCCQDLQLLLSAGYINTPISGDINACPYKQLIESFIQPIHSKTLIYSGMKHHYCVLAFLELVVLADQKQIKVNVSDSVLTCCLIKLD